MRIKWTGVSAVSRAEDTFELTLSRRELQELYDLLGEPVRPNATVQAIEEFVKATTPGRNDGKD